MSKELPIAVVTVRFGQPVTGEQLAALVLQAVRQHSSGASFVVEHRYYDGDVMSFGQTSGYAYDHIRVVPSLDGLPFFALTESYSEIKATSHSWGGSVYAVGYEQQSVINAVKEFAVALTNAYETALTDGFPEYIEPKSARDDW